MACHSLVVQEQVRRWKETEEALEAEQKKKLSHNQGEVMQYAPSNC